MHALAAYHKCVRACIVMRMKWCGMYFVAPNFKRGVKCLASGMMLRGVGVLRANVVDGFCNVWPPTFYVVDMPLCPINRHDGSRGVEATRMTVGGLVQVLHSRVTQGCRRD